jgi:hypothetical protein
MKQLLALLALLICLSLVAAPTYAQSNAYNKGDKVVSAGIGFGGLGGIYGSTSMPTISLAFDYGLDVPKISVGGIVGYASSTDDFGYGYSWKYTYIIIGARGAYHFLEDNKNIDAYGGLLLGYNIVSATWNGSLAEPGYGYSASASYMLFGVFVGGRYYFSPKFAVFGELGYGAGILTVGISYKL